MSNPARTPTETQLIEAIGAAIDALDFYAAANCWGDANIAQQTAANLRATLTHATAKINIDQTIADSESAQAIMHEQSKDYDAAAHDANLARIAAEEAINPSVDSWALFREPAIPTAAETEYLDADGPTGSPILNAEKPR